MADSSEQLTLSPGLKRTYDGDMLPSSKQMAPLTPSRHTQPIPNQRSQSPTLSTTSSSLTDLSSSAPQNSSTGPPGSPSKKRKLTFAERQVKKAAQERLKEEKAKQKAGEQARKDEEKRLKDEEKRKRAEDREAAKKVKEVEKAEKEAAKAEKQKAKDAEKARQEAERLKKERVSDRGRCWSALTYLLQAQMRLGAFFGRPAPASTPPSTPEDVSSGVSSRRSSIASIDMERPELDEKPVKTVNADFSNWILPFFPHEHTDVAPYNRFLISHATTVLGIDWLGSPKHTARADHDLLQMKFGPAKARTKQVIPIERVIAEISGAHDRPIDLTGSSGTGNAVKLLESTPYKILSFREDFRPPYQGTFTRTLSPRISRRLRRKPAQRVMPKVDYDYDSEAEWEAPEAGDEDLEDEDELSDDEDAVDEMADFLDDEDETARRRVITTDVEPVCTGLFWEGEADSTIAGIDLALYRMDVLSDDTRLPIDPYSTDHWSQTGKTTPSKNKHQPSDVEESTTPAMQPPRLPLVVVNAPNGSPLKKFVTMSSNVIPTHGQKENEAPDASNKSTTNPKKPTKMISPDLMPAFKTAVAGSDLNKVALVEILKKQFPKCSKDAIKGTLETIAVRQGSKEADKRWVLTTR